MATRLLTVGQTADRLSLSEKTLRNWILERRITVVRVGRCVRVPEDIVKAIIRRGTTPAQVGE